MGHANTYRLWHDKCGRRPMSRGPLSTNPIATHGKCRFSSKWRFAFPALLVAAWVAAQSLSASPVTYDFVPIGASSLGNNPSGKVTVDGSSLISGYFDLGANTYTISPTEYHVSPYATDLVLEGNNGAGWPPPNNLWLDRWTVNTITPQFYEITSPTQYGFKTGDWGIGNWRVATAAGTVPDATSTAALMLVALAASAFPPCRRRRLSDR